MKSYFNLSALVLLQLQCIHTFTIILPSPYLSRAVRASTSCCWLYTSIGKNDESITTTTTSVKSTEDINNSDTFRTPDSDEKIINENDAGTSEQPDLFYTGQTRDDDIEHEITKEATSDDIIPGSDSSSFSAEPEDISKYTACNNNVDESIENYDNKVDNSHAYDQDDGESETYSDHESAQEAEDIISSTATDGDEDGNGDDNEEKRKLEAAKELRKKAVILQKQIKSSSTSNRSRKNVSESMSKRSSRDTSVGKRRIGAASLGRLSRGGKVGKLIDNIKTSSISPEEMKDDENNNNNNDPSSLSSGYNSASSTSTSTTSTSYTFVDSTVQSIMDYSDESSITQLNPSYTYFDDQISVEAQLDQAQLDLYEELEQYQSSLPTDSQYLPNVYSYEQEIDQYQQVEQPISDAQSEYQSEVNFEEAELYQYQQAAEQPALQTQLQSSTDDEEEHLDQYEQVEKSSIDTDEEPSDQEQSQLQPHSDEKQLDLNQHAEPLQSQSKSQLQNSTGTDEVQLNQHQKVEESETESKLQPSAETDEDQLYSSNETEQSQYSIDAEEEQVDPYQQLQLQQQSQSSRTYLDIDKSEYEKYREYQSQYGGKYKYNGEYLDQYQQIQPDIYDLQYKEHQYHQSIDEEVKEIPLSEPDGEPGVDKSLEHLNVPTFIRDGTVIIPQRRNDISKTRFLHSLADLKNSASIRISRQTDDGAIANLRYSVFNNDSSGGVKKSWIERARNVLFDRRHKGTMCLIACVNFIDAYRWMIGSIECSTHEFVGTELGRRRPAGSILYITEVAVSSRVRRNGIGMQLLKAMDEVAYMRNIETLYLHVEQYNIAAIKLYLRAGYDIIDPEDADYAYIDFTNKVNKANGLIDDQSHILMQKVMTSTQTWLDS